MTAADGAGAVAPLVVVGAGGHGREAVGVARALERAGRATWSSLAGVAAASADRALLDRLDVVWLGPEPVVVELGATWCAAVGDPSVRRQVVQDLQARGAGPAVTLVHPEAIVEPDADLASGVLVPAGAVVAAEAHLGAHAHLNVGAVVGAGAVLEPYATLSPGSVVEPGAVIGEAALVGAGAVVAAGVRVGCDAVVGAGAAVAVDVPDGVTVVGVPARPRPAPAR